MRRFDRVRRVGRVGATVTWLAALASIGVVAAPQAKSRPNEATRPAEPGPQGGDGAAPTADREGSSARGRITAAFALFGSVVEERRDEAATDGGRVATATVPMPPPPVVERTPDTLSAPRFEPAMGLSPVAYAEPEAAVVSPTDRVFASVAPATAVSVPATPTAIAVPLPRRRPTPPRAESGEVKVASLGTDVEVIVPSVHEAAVADARPILGAPKRVPKQALPYLAVLKREAARNKVPLWLAIGVGWVESKFQPSLRGSHGVVGLMQVMPSTARFQGYRGPTESLLEPETNIVWGMRELGWAWEKSGGNACLTVAKYKGGIATRSISDSARRYCDTAKRVTGMI